MVEVNKVRTKYEDIVTVEHIGSTNVETQHDLLALATNENLSPSSKDDEKILLLAIDVQNDFMQNGSLGVPNAHEDILNLTTFVYQNMKKITDICLSLDTHVPQQIFHPYWWKNKLGEHPQPYTIISFEDVQKGVWQAVAKEKESISYVAQLEKHGRKQLCIWPYHCIQGTFGATLESQFANLVYFHSVARQSEPIIKVKGMDPLTEMYGIFRPEIATDEQIDYPLLEKMKSYDKIFVAGEAKSHCVLESVGQMLEYFGADKEMLSKIYVLEDCTSSIPGFEEQTEKTFKQWVDTHGIHLVQSTEVII